MLSAQVWTFNPTQKSAIVSAIFDDQRCDSLSVQYETHDIEEIISNCRDEVPQSFSVSGPNDATYASDGTLELNIEDPALHNLLDSAFCP